jgi:hypothetical protein
MTPRRPATKSVQDHLISASVKDAVYDMESELRHLQGLIALLTILGEAHDSVEPVALSALARSGRETSEALLTGWRTAFEGLRDC